MNAMDTPNDTVDATRPWLGLASFSEATRAYFYGRDEEVGELARRVQRKLLTVLFGQSGLGKTSILRAGIVPRLRQQGYCPVYVRIDYADGAPSPAAQVQRALHAAAPRSGFDGGEGASLWELLHRRTLTILDADGKPVIPLLIIDQFEEMFTLAQSDAGGRARATEFVEELAALVENRPPQALEARFEADDSLVEQFDFGREDVRVLIALREDYLAHLEQLKRVMPSVTQNRMRLAPMTGAQALVAVRGPGGRLVDEEVAAAIVRFVANGAEIAHAQVEPSLLSLICRELNDARIAAARQAITLDLLAGSHASILSDFYERALGDHPPAVRNVIEDVLLTASGFRENVAEERVVLALTQAGAAAGTLQDLVNRRLLRIEERLDIRRVELTHDVLCSVVRASRDARRERELAEEGARALAARQAQAALAHRSLVRTRQVAVACVTLAVAAVGATVYAYLATGRAQAATATARSIQASSDQARRQAEQLTAYLLDDFARELAGSGKQQMFVDLGQRVQQYYDALPAIAPNTDTELYRTLAQVTYAKALLRQNKLAEARPLLAAAVASFERRRSAMPPSEQNDVALVIALLGQSAYDVAASKILDAAEIAERAAKLLKPRMAQPAPSASLKRTYVKALLARSEALRLESGHAQAKPLLLEAQAMLPQLDGPDIGDVSTALDLAQTKLLLGEVAQNEADYAGRMAYARSAAAIAERVLALQQDHVIALHALGDAHLGMGRALVAGPQPRHALPFFALAEQTYAREAKLDPADVVRARDQFSLEVSWSEYLVSAGQFDDALARMDRIMQRIERVGTKDALVADDFFNVALLQAEVFEDLGKMDAAAERVAAAGRTVEASFATSPDIVLRIYFKNRINVARIELFVAQGRHREAAAFALEQLQRMEARPAGTRSSDVREDDVRLGGARALFRSGDTEAAERLLRPAFAGRIAPDPTRSLRAQRRNVEYFLLYARLLDKLGRHAEATVVIAPLQALLRHPEMQVSERPSHHYVLAGAYAAIACASEGAARATALATARHELTLMPAGVAPLESVAALKWMLGTLDAQR